jgi:hypothetical protein
MGRSSRDRLSGHAALPVRRPRQRQHGELTGHHVRHFDGIADSPDVRVLGAHLRIDDDSTSSADPESGRRRQSGLRPHAEREDHEVCWQSGSTFRDHDQPSVGRPIDPRQAIAQLEPHALRKQVIHERGRDFRVEGRHDLWQFLQDDGRKTAMDQVLTPFLIR